ncbi:hypothetical protein [Clostridium sp.]|uniref:hypothetical protein n=1 Tax=Clostridium sp. TaxID=1506 RepID=UPI00284C9B46|nr:hypothetical protein [Clostridium sp.]MDR3597924.1 hypothetical protein [Clostridium sp.]
MDEELIVDVVKSKIIAYKLENYHKIKPKTKKHLMLIETYFQNCITIYENCILELDKINLSIRGVCSNSNVGKSTVYENKDILYTYIQNRINEMNDKFDIFSKKEIFNLETKNTQLEQRLNNMIINYIELANLKAKIDDLYKENEKLKKQKDALAQERIELIKTNNDLALELTKLRNNIIEFPNENN